VYLSIRNIALEVSEQRVAHGSCARFNVVFGGSNLM